MRCFLFNLWMILFLGLFSLAQAAPTSSFQNRLDNARISLEQIEFSVGRRDISRETLQALREQAEPINTTIRGLLMELTPKLMAAKIRLEQLGPPPSEKGVVESSTGAAERHDQEKIFNELNEQVRRSRVLVVQGDQIRATISARLNELFLKETFALSPGLLNPDLWIGVVGELPNDLEKWKWMWQNWFQQLASSWSWWSFLFLLSSLGALFGIYMALFRVSGRFTARPQDSAQPSPLRQVVSALQVLLLTTLLPLTCFLAVVFLLDQFTVSIDREQPVTQAFMASAVRISLTYAIARALLAPTLPQWRILNLTEPVVGRLSHLVISLALVVSATKIFEALNSVMRASLSLSVLVRALGALLVAWLMARGLNGIMSYSQRLHEEETGGKNDPTSEKKQEKKTETGTSATVNIGTRLPYTAPTRDWYWAMRLAAWTSLVVIVLAVLVGYITFASFLIDQIAWIAGVCSTLYLLLLAGELTVEKGFHPKTALGRVVISSIGLRREALQQLGILLAGALRVAVFLLAFLLLLAPWGIESTDMLSYMKAAFFGFKVGDVTLSLSSVISSLFFFAITWLSIRAIRTWLEVKYLPLTRLDTSLRNSIKTSLGYIGFFVALYMALAPLGLNFEKLALVAGALSFGIGLGLQSVFNNFVSGLILLWERTVRVGDWVVVGNEQGYVRRINVRATEIETFDRATVIMPNSNLISGVVKNWVRTDRIGRLTVLVYTNHQASPEEIQTLLVSVAKSHELVLTIPTPSALFVGFDEVKLHFELHCFLDDIEKGNRVKSDLNLTIFKNLIEKGLALKPIHQEVRLHSTDSLENWLKCVQPSVKTPLSG